MKRLVMLSAALLVTLFTVVPSFPRAQTGTQVFDVPFDVNVFVPCANDGQGELILGSGNVHAVLSTTINGNNIKFRSEFNPTGLTALGQVTGTTYHATGVTRQDVTASVAAFPFEATYVNRFFMVSEGAGGNFKFSETQHLTINANGTITVDFYKPVVTCQ